MSEHYDDSIYMEEHWVLTCDFCGADHHFDKNTISRQAPEHHNFRRLFEKDICRECEEKAFVKLANINLDMCS